jgi:hypothetical protein
MPASFSYAQPSEANSIVGGDVEQLKQLLLLKKPNRKRIKLSG